METPQDPNTPKANPNLDELTQNCQKQCKKCLRPIDPDCDICGIGSDEEREEQTRSIFDVLWMNCTKRAFESKKRRL